MKTRIITLISAALVLTCCTKEIAPAGPESGDVFSLNLQTTATKIALGDKDGSVYPLVWQTGDAVVINGTNVSKPLGSEFNGLQNATFTTEDKLSFPITIVYPASVKAGNGRITIPAEQDADSGKFANGYAIMTGYTAGNTTTVNMTQTCGYLKVSLTGSQTLSSISLKALGCEFLAGNFTVNAKTGTIAPVAGSVGNSSIKLLTGKTLSGTAQDYIFALPAGNYSKGFKLIVRDNAGKQMSKTIFSSGGKTITGGLMLEAQTLAYSPSEAEEEIFEVSESSITFPGRNYSQKVVSASAGDEDVTVATSGLDWCKLELPSVIPAGMTASFSIAPNYANVCDIREGSITFTGKTSGKKVVIPVNQGNLYQAKHGFPARFYSPDETTEMGNNWLKEGYGTCTSGGGVGCTFMSVGTITEGRKVTISLYSDHYSAKGMLAGDYFQISAPVIEIPAGTDLDLMITISPNAATAPKYWLVEWYDGGEWRSNPRYTAAEDGTTKYSFYIKYFSSANYRTHIETYTMQNPVKNDFVRVRMRAVGKWNNGGGTLGNNTADVFFNGGTYPSYFVCYSDEATPIKDTHKVAQYGNSITYYHGSAMMLKELARREGHQMDVRINLKGSQEFEHHLTKLPMSQEVTEEGGYDWAILQDGSYFHAEYATGSKSGVVGITPKYTPEEIEYWQHEMTKKVKSVSPNCQTLLTSEHSYSRKAADDNYLGFGSFENFDKYQWQGAVALATGDPNLNWIAPAGKGFARARANYGFTEAYNWMQHTDNYHPNMYGAYMRACITYLTMFGGSFGENAADCCLPPSDAAKLRQAAMDIVNDSTREDYHFHK